MNISGLVVLVFAIAEAKKLPPFIEVCHRPNLNMTACLLRNIDILKPRFAKGVPELFIPPMDPLVIPKASLNSGDSFTASFSDIKIYGTNDFRLSKANFDLDGMGLDLELTFPALRIRSQYNIDGKLLVVQLKGQGLADGNYIGEVKKVKCLENGRFYRDPGRAAHKMWTPEECSRYFLCLENEVFDFKCSADLLFDVSRQICDFKLNVDNCDLTTESVIPKPLLEGAGCPEGYLGCADSTCLPQEYFCDGSSDCQDGSDEGDCNLLNDPNGATPCDTKTCLLPDCFCSRNGTEIPGKLSAPIVPQMILLTFDDAINDENWDLYSKILLSKNYRNPNRCPIKATFFISHQYNNYYYTQKLWNEGHEIAVHSITHRGPEEWWAINATIEDWFDEMVGQANILNRFSKVGMDQIRGMRAPFLRPGWNKQFLMMKEFGFVYDSSIVAPFSNPPLWPYTLDHKIPHNCTGAEQICPTRPYKGLWELPLNQLEAGGFTCAMVDSCPPGLSGADLYAMLMHNFKRHYLSNRAPMGLYFHSTWFKNPEYFTAFQKFMSDVLKEPDVWFVSSWQAIQWMKRPTAVDQIHSFASWSCKTSFDQSEMACSLPNVCRLHSRVFQEDRLLQTCASCPQKYPWIRNEFGFD